MPARKGAIGFRAVLSMHSLFDFSLEILVILGIVAANGFFVATEFALVKVRSR